MPEQYCNDYFPRISPPFFPIFYDLMSVQSTTHGRMNTDDIMAHGISVLETLKNVSSLASTVPCLNIVISAALSLISTIEKMRGDKERCHRLSRRVSNLLKDLKQAVSNELDIAENDDLSASLPDLQSALIDIEEDLKAMAAKSATLRFLRRGSIATRLDEHIDTVDEVSRSFNRAVLMSLRKATNDLIKFDKQQLRLFRFPDIRLRRVRGTWRASTELSGENWEAEWKGRLVAVRVLCPTHSREDTLSLLLSTVHGLHQCRYPYIAQMLGYSHPSERSRFLVLETGHDVLQYLKATAPLSRLRTYLQLYIDFHSRGLDSYMSTMTVCLHCPPKMTARSFLLPRTSWMYTGIVSGTACAHCLIRRVTQLRTRTMMFKVFMRS
ncbi:hypothetical protein OBBRIDRAFT_510293 [Obba rivulosa]|uniref:Mixed lineage kinase domain-containing protein n=1 Tax=Obba rivulosa TaxID=1052685 RepID=A0A8E2DM65_9APHY|nr:hypothetical protein OBBRIDRAFT_510293 [Obba rivulosa]